MWRSGNLELENKMYFYEIKLTEYPSKFGIFGGRIAELYLYDEDDNKLAEFNREWIIPPAKGSIGYGLVKIILKEYNRKKG